MPGEAAAGRERGRGTLIKVRKSLREDMVSCLKVRIYFPIGAKSLGFQSLGTVKSRKGIGTAAARLVQHWQECGS